VTAATHHSCRDQHAAAVEEHQAEQAQSRQQDSVGNDAVFPQAVGQPCPQQACQDC